ncbi:MAG: hypothetical protein ACLUEK_00715 [Oscillospiraceae bacterium]
MRKEPFPIKNILDSVCARMSRTARSPFPKPPMSFTVLDGQTTSTRTPPGGF